MAEKPSGLFHFISRNTFYTRNLILAEKKGEMARNHLNEIHREIMIPSLSSGRNVGTIFRI